MTKPATGSIDEIVSRLWKIKKGYSAEFPLPPFGRRPEYLRINGYAHRAFGAGNYKLRTAGNVVYVDRVR